MKAILFLTLALASGAATAALIVVEDRGGVPAAPYYRGIVKAAKRQPAKRPAPRPTPPAPKPAPPLRR
jgi:hypothetical protein